MITAFIIIVIVALIAMIPMGIKEAKKPGFPWMTTIIGAIVVAVCLVVPTTALISAVGDTSEFVTSIDGFDGVHQNLYFDNAESKYFVVEADRWDVSKMQYRYYLETDLVEQYLEYQEKINNIPLFG